MFPMSRTSHLPGGCGPDPIPPSSLPFPRCVWPTRVYAPWSPGSWLDVGVPTMWILVWCHILAVCNLAFAPLLAVSFRGRAPPWRCYWSLVSGPSVTSSLRLLRSCWHPPIRAALVGCVLRPLSVAGCLVCSTLLHLPLVPVFRTLLCPSVLWPAPGAPRCWVCDTSPTAVCRVFIGIPVLSCGAVDRCMAPSRFRRLRKPSL